MANLSPMTRKQQVLEVLSQHVGTWVDGTRLANEEVGGSEGLRRLRELISEGYNIQRRKHPDPTREIYQYRLTDTETRTGTTTPSESKRREVQAGWDIPTYEPSDPQELVEAWQQED